MPKNSGSVAATISQAQRRSNRVNRGCNGRDVQLDRLGEQLTAPTRATKKRFAPDEGMQLEVNARAPLPKKRRTKARATQPSSHVVHPSPPRQQPSIIVEDNRYGFQALQSTQLITAPVSPTAPIPSPGAVQSALLALPPSDRSSPHLSVADHEASDPGSEDEHGVQFEIDEQSDDEDERQAFALLRAAPNSSVPPAEQTSSAVTQHGNRNFAEVGEDTSVLQSHYSRNRPPKPPTFRNSPPTPSPAPGSQVHRDPNSPLRTLESYPPQWQEVIGYAKRAFRAYVAGQCGFPDPTSGVKEARECLQDAIEVHAEEGGTLEPGYTITRDMAMLVFAESWQLRSQLKTDIRVQVRGLKTLFPDNFSGDPQRYRAAIRDCVDAWVQDGSYLHDTVPGSDNQIHFGHPIIASTCKSFYFDKWSDISTFDRDTFYGSVPKSLVALVAAVYRNVLDEWSTGTHSTKKLETKHYSQVYQAVLDAMETVDNDPHHGAPFRERLASWAGFGRSMNNSVTSSNILVTIHLNLNPPAN